MWEWNNLLNRDFRILKQYHVLHPLPTCTTHPHRSFEWHPQFVWIRLQALLDHSNLAKKKMNAIRSTISLPCEMNMGLVILCAFVVGEIFNKNSRIFGSVSSPYSARLKCLLNREFIKFHCLRIVDILVQPCVSILECVIWNAWFTKVLSPVVRRIFQESYEIGNTHWLRSTLQFVTVVYHGG